MRRRASSCAFSLLILFVLVGPLPVAGQTLEKGSITGTVYDPLGAGLPGATIKLTRLATGLERKAATDHDGRFAFSVLPRFGDHRAFRAAGGEPSQHPDHILTCATLP